MKGGGFDTTGGGRWTVYPKLSVVLLLAFPVATMGGFMFGYDIGISGSIYSGVTSMDPFLLKFFPSVYRKMKLEKKTKGYRTFDSQLLMTFTSSLYLAAMIASLFASFTTRVFGRKWSILVGGFTFLVGAAINEGAMNVAMLITGYILLGVGIGFTNQSVPLYLSEMAPARMRGAYNVVFQLMITIDIYLVNLVNYYTDKIKGGWAWRVSLAAAAVPVAMMTINSILTIDTPNSLIYRGKDAKAKPMLRWIRETDDIEEEYKDLVAASEASKLVEYPWRNIIQRKYRPQLTMAILIPFFQQLTGINVIMFYAPMLFKMIGLDNNASLASAAIIGFVNVHATIVSIMTVDWAGRRKLFLLGGGQMLISQILLGMLIAIKFETTGQGHFSKGYASIVVALICVYVAGFAWSWGPLGWLVPSEIFPLEIRSVGQSINVSVNMLFTFLIAQVLPTMLCHMKFGLFYFFAGWVVVMTTFIYFFLPETKNVPIEKMALIWKNHWYWRKFISDEDIHTGVEMSKGKPKSVAV